MLIKSEASNARYSIAHYKKIKALNKMLHFGIGLSPYMITIVLRLHFVST